MDHDKIQQVRSYLQGMDERIRSIDYRIIILRDAYFFFVNQGHVARYYEGQHKELKGWYCGVVSFSKQEGGPLYVFVSEILYKHIDAIDLFLKILYQMLIYTRADFVKLKYKKMKRRLWSYLRANLPEGVDIGPERLDNLLAPKGDAELSRGADIIIPHMSLSALVERLPGLKEPVSYIEDVKPYLQRLEYMHPLQEESRHGHRH
ncbi:MAG: hypothetical protein QW390_00360 [Candidatus Bathyarchaeia archaeon]